MQRQGQVEADGSPATRHQPPPKGRPQTQPDLSVPGRVVEFAREVRSELRQVAWPTRPEVANSATVVFITLVILVSLIFVLNYAFSHALIHLYPSS
jgi:preprotein translocase subunit SecE